MIETVGDKTTHFKSGLIYVCIDMSRIRRILVLDLLDGVVVHAVRGERSKYRPVHHMSKVVGTSDALEILDALKPKEVYIADLDHIMGKGDNRDLIQEISSRWNTMLDYGVKSIDDMETASGMSDVVVVGTETMPLHLIEMVIHENVVAVSVDIKNGRVLMPEYRGEPPTPADLIRAMKGWQLKDVIILEMDRIGTSLGVNEQLIRNVTGISGQSMIIGGGIRNEDDLGMLEEMGVSGALIGTAVHKGDITIM